MEELKNGLCELKEMVCSLKAETNEETIIKQLQKIAEKLIAEYVIEVEGITIEPLWVEAYYFNKNVFSDCNTHLSEKQKNRFGQLYFHEKGRGGGRGGVDICLSDSEDYYLSFLLKRTLINGEFVKQIKIEDALKKQGKTKEELETAKVILVRREENQNYTVGYTTRVRLEKPCYREEKLAAVRLDVIGEYDFISDRKDLTPLVHAEMQEYISTHDKTKKEYEDDCRKMFGWYPDCVSKMVQKKFKADKK